MKHNWVGLCGVEVLYKCIAMLLSILKEFCFALYLMERYREGRPLPESLPSNVLFDETPMSMTGQPKIAYGNAAWGIGQGIFPYLHCLKLFLFS